MRKVEEYIHQARECRRLAGACADEEQQRQLEEMAKTWEALARDRADQIRRQNGLDKASKP